MIPTIRYIDANHTHKYWDTVRPFLEAALEKGEGAKDYNIHHIQQFIASGQWLLLVAIDNENNICGASTVSFVNYPINRVAFVTSIGGKFIICKDTFEQLTGILKQFGATKIQCYVRPAMERLLDKLYFEPKTKLVERML